MILDTITSQDLLAFVVAKWDFFRKSATDITAGIAVLIVMAFIKFFRHLPKRMIYQYRKKGQIKSFNKASEINKIMNFLGNHSKAMRMFIIRYHNHGPQKMTVDWEETSSTVCHRCEIKCSSYKNIKPIQEQWQGFRLSDIWLEVVTKTLHLEGTVNDVTDHGFDKLTKEFWEKQNVHLYKETFIKFKWDGFYALGGSYCERYKGISDTKANPDILLIQAKTKLEKLL
jgi:hypothetical protein